MYLNPSRSRRVSHVVGGDVTARGAIVTLASSRAVRACKGESRCHVHTFRLVGIIFWVSSSYESAR